MPLDSHAYRRYQVRLRRAKTPEGRIAALETTLEELGLDDADGVAVASTKGPK